MPIAATITKQYDNGQSLEVIGTLTASGDYSAGGDTVSVADLNIKSTRAPLFLTVKGKGGYIYEYIIGTAKLIVRECAGSATLAPEIAASAYPSGVTGDTITFRGLFLKNI